MRIVARKKHQTALSLLRSLSLIAASGLALSPGAALAQQKSLKETLTGGHGRRRRNVTAGVHTLRGLVTYYVLFFIDLESRRVDNAGELTSRAGRPIQSAGRKPFRSSSTPAFPSLRSTTVSKAHPRKTRRQCTGTTATFGTYTVDEASKTITVRNVGRDSDSSN
jgi:hypothetical protein